MSYRDNDRSDYGGRSSGGGSMRRSDGGGRSRGGPYSRDGGRDGGRDRRDRDGGHDRRGGGGGGREDRGPSVFVGNIPWASTEEELTDLFSEYGKVTNFRLLMDRETNRPRGKFYFHPYIFL